MKESISKLRKICQETRVVKGRAERNWVVLLYQRISIYFTWFFLHTPASANQITLLAFFLAFVGGFLISFANYWLALAAVLVLYLINILDRVDGEISRYRKTSGIKGNVLDDLVDCFIHPTYFAGISISIFLMQGNLLLLSLGFVIIIFYLLNCLLIERTNEYQKKKFHESPKQTVRLLAQNPISFLTFLGSSKHFIDFAIMVSVVFSMLSQFVLFFAFFIPLSFFLRLRVFLKSK